MGALVKQSTHAGAHREHSASRGGKLLHSSGKIRHGRATKTNQTAANPVRVSPLNRRADRQISAETT